MYINGLKNKKVFIGAGGNDLEEIFNSDGVISLLKMTKNFAANIIGINVASSKRSSHVL